VHIYGDAPNLGYTGDVASFRQIVAACPVPVVAAGGPKAARRYSSTGKTFRIRRI